MAEFVTLAPEKLSALREMNPCLMSYNIEFAEVTGGTFWKAYTPEQIAGTEPFQVGKGGNITDMYKDLMQVYDRSTSMMRNCANLQRNWERHGCVYPELGRPRPIMILMELAMARCRKDI